MIHRPSTIEPPLVSRAKDFHAAGTPVNNLTTGVVPDLSAIVQRKSQVIDLSVFPDNEEPLDLQFVPETQAVGQRSEPNARQMAA